MSRLDGVEVLPGDRAVALGARQLLQAGTSVGGVLGEVEHVPTGVGRRRLALEAGKTVLDVGRVVRFAPLAVIDDVQAGVSLLADALADGFAHARVEGRHVVQTALLPGHEHLEQVVGSRQAAAVGGQDTVRAPLHRQPPSWTQAPEPGWRYWRRPCTCWMPRSGSASRRKWFPAARPLHELRIVHPNAVGPRQRRHGRDAERSPAPSSARQVFGKRQRGCQLVIPFRLQRAHDGHYGANGQQCPQRARPVLATSARPTRFRGGR